MAPFVGILRGVLTALLWCTDLELIFKFISTHDTSFLAYFRLSIQPKSVVFLFIKTQTKLIRTVALTGSSSFS